METEREESFVSCRQITTHLLPLMKALTAEHLSPRFRPLTFQHRNLKERFLAMTNSKSQGGGETTSGDQVPGAPEAGGAAEPPSPSRIPQAAWIDFISATESGSRWLRLAEETSTHSLSKSWWADTTPCFGLENCALGPTPEERARNDDDEERAALTAMRTSLCFRHNRSWAQNKDDLSLPLCLTASRTLRRLEEGSLRGARLPEGLGRAEHLTMEEGPEVQAPPRQSPVAPMLASSSGGKAQEAIVSAGSTREVPGRWEEDASVDAGPPPPPHD